MLISSRLDHPNIVKSYRIGSWFSLPYIEMEYVNGASLNKVLKKCSTLTVEQVLSIGINVCKALHYAHNKIFSISSQTYYGIIHRDLKPANIMLGKEGQIKLSDFGIAYPVVFPDLQTDSLTIMGTMPYLAPEQFENKNITYRTDIYILGVTLYELLCGVRAFPQSNISELIISKNTGSYIPIRSIIHVDNAISDIIEKAMSTCPSERFSTAHQFGQAMENILCTRESAKFELLALVKRLWYE
jgi:serine/threonine-protein kinase